MKSTNIIQVFNFVKIGNRLLLFLKYTLEIIFYAFIL